MKLYSVTLCTAIQVEFENTQIRVEENVGSVEIVLIANQAHNESYSVGLINLSGRVRKKIVQCVKMFVQMSLYDI